MPKPLRPKLQVFVSSTYKDLIEDRQAAVGAILKAGHIPAGMELFNAGDRSQLDIIKRWIDESDVFMLILAGRYGTIEPISELSYTECEYDYAVEIGKPFFAVVISQAALDERAQLRLAKEVLELSEPKKLNAFRHKVTNKICTFFSDYKDIQLAVHNSLPELEHQYSLKGWVRGESVPNATALINENTRLSEENGRLAQELKRLQNLPVNSASQEETELLKVWTAAESLASKAIAVPDHFINDNVARAYKSLEALKLQIQAMLPRLGEVSPYNKLGMFALYGERLTTGLIRQAAVQDQFFIAPCITDWILERLVDQPSENRYVLSSLGKTLYRTMKEKKDEFSF